MPNANIEKSIARGSGQLGGAQIQEVVYEGYGPGGVAVIVECATDNKNRTLSDVRNAFNKGGGNMAESGAVAFQFSKKGIIVLKPSDKDASMLNAIDAGADDIEEDEGTLTLYTSSNQLNSVRSKLVELGEVMQSAELAYVPATTVPISDEATAQKIVNLIDALEELDDVSGTTNNADIETAILETL
jgi:YebC/PmpR family DNA-binding regulatory protein